MHEIVTSETTVWTASPRAQGCLYEGLVMKALLVPDHLQRDVRLRFVVVDPHDLCAFCLETCRLWRVTSLKSPATFAVAESDQDLPRTEPQAGGHGRNTRRRAAP